MIETIGRIASVGIELSIVIFGVSATIYIACYFLSDWL